jgi:hypothetical protein
MKLYHIITIIIVLLSIIIGFLYFYKNNDNDSCVLINKEINEYDLSKLLVLHDNKPYLWIYWDNIDGKNHSAIELCYKTVIRHCSKSFNIIKLNKNDILKWLPELIEYQEYIDKLQIAHKVDVYRIMLLYKYGGLYIDADIIVLRDPIEIIYKLCKHEFVGFGCTGNKCSYGYKTPSNAMLASRAGSILMGNVSKHLLKKIKEKDKFEYFDLGKYVIWEEIHNIKDYEYYHYSNNYDGTRDKHGNWITSDIIFSNTPIEYTNVDNMIFLMWYNSNVTDDIKTMTVDDLMNKDCNFTKYIKKSLNIKEL